ncbi:MAG: SAM-dependent methyltransferase [Nitrospira sp. SB0677_bin_15]|nr:SAM-dependent methyltransferase [Nitrospira sp. SB0667_bin_9]MYG40774.1 SAM-dependent methyltransferase [Nitrospira sp. SB0677_bin_15]
MIEHTQAMESTDSPLMRRITALIQETGPLTFSRFMELALYDEEHGYYATGGGRATAATSPIGREGGDFFTAPSLSPILAKCLVRQLEEIDERLGHPPVFDLVEIGPGNGTLLRDLLQECQEQQGSFFPRLACILVERSPAFRRRQQDALAAWQEQGVGMQWVDDLQSIPDGSLTGALLSNELVDAFPVHRVRMEEDGLRELYVTTRDRALQERWGEPSTPELASFLSDLDVELPAGFTTEINLEAVKWIKQVARVLDRGVVITIDYGHTAQDYYAPERKNGTLMGYYRHTVTTDPFTRIGEQDLTAHVNFSSLARTGEQAGLTTTGFTNLQHFLMSLGIEELVEGREQESEAVQAAAQLLRPHGMGTTFKVLMQHKGLVAPALRGLRHRAFFESALEMVH